MHGKTRDDVLKEKPKCFSMKLVHKRILEEDVLCKKNHNVFVSIAK